MRQKITLAEKLKAIVNKTALLYDLTDMAYREATKDAEEQKDET